MDPQKIYKIKFAQVYPLYVTKVERKGRTQAELDEVICWLTGYSETELSEAAVSDSDLEQFITSAPALNPNRKQIKGVICGYRVESIEDTMTQEIRYMDKLIDELAKGKSMEKILRRPEGQ